MKKPSNSPDKPANNVISDNFVDAPAVESKHTTIKEELHSQDILALSTAKANWYFGEWEELTNIDLNALVNHPDIAILTALKAAGYQQFNQLDDAEKHIQLARKLGCDNKLIAKLLIAGIHNSLGRISALQKNDKKIEAHFKSAVDVGEQSQAAKLASHARSVKEVLSMGLLPQVTEIIENSAAQVNPHKQRPSSYLTRMELMQKQLNEVKKKVDSNQQQSISGMIQPEDSDYLESPIYSAKSYGLYSKLASSKKESMPLLLLETKSMPRSGLHFFRNTLEDLLQGDFSFCEWYQEPGCCKKSPCALTSYASSNKKGMHVRMTKSHDFTLDDPVYPLPSNIRRVILWRDPLFVLTSYFALEELSRHQDILAENGINMPKIWLKHESSLVREAYNLIDKNFITPNDEYLSEWLNTKEVYLSGFINKWITPFESPKTYNVDVVNYNDLPKYLISLLEEYKKDFQSKTRVRIDNVIEKLNKNYKPRKDPFILPSVSISKYVKRNMDLFIERAEVIKSTINI